MVKECNCEHKSQDEIHGKGKRVYNEFTKNNVKMARCTVCLKEIVING